MKKIWMFVLAFLLSSAVYAEVTNLTAPLHKLVQDGRDIYLGEIHGTREVPELVYELVTAALSDQHPERVTVSLELDSSAQSLLGFAWSGTDGRHSQAMFELVKKLQVLTKDYALSIHYQHDDYNKFESSQSVRERQMGQAIKVLAKNTQLIALSGNAHSAEQPFGAGAPVPVGAYVGSGVLNIYLASVQAYTAWNCYQGPCKEQQFEPWPDNQPNAGTLVSGELVHHDYIYFMPIASASPPQSLLP
ncbi:hypothetical protein QWI17_02345 [Gilvimarinus sp. SDUM040013]|uniref:Uncharacterized protein n=1 Tax=Gilvimarinus gilvus TaxID=3058038 RepID=A0ABU4RZH8_9GAMM|nr:hypothetical protein [Gilvimarinus sp. SDUM040013]MDO3384672.1 hypothetical protein [Gilvimarinus sp. SDUM040013]MDX6850258.1 hypothetical protein [Gilvimarinus sp. SDUM040013]